MNPSYIKEICNETITQKELNNSIKELEKEEEKKIIEYNEKRLILWEELNHKNILTHIKRKHKQLIIFIDLLNLLEEEDNNFKKIFRKELLNVIELIEHFNLDYYKVLESINFEIESIKKRIDKIKDFESEIINYFVNERVKNEG